jgi:SAM domain (Sterile alpha motif)
VLSPPFRREFLTPARTIQTARGLLLAAMQQIADWLKKLGISEYAERFGENDIDMPVLPDLTDQHLKDLGVALGHRLKMPRAIRDLGNSSRAATVASSPSPWTMAWWCISRSPRARG